MEQIMDLVYYILENPTILFKVIFWTIFGIDLARGIPNAIGNFLMEIKKGIEKDKKRCGF